MGRSKSPPPGFCCPYQDNCPHLEGLSANWLFRQHMRSSFKENDHYQIREAMAAEIGTLEAMVQERDLEIQTLRTENAMLHRSRFKASKAKSAKARGQEPGAQPRKPRGAPKGHPPWNRKPPEHIDHTVHVEAPLLCPHCQCATDPHPCGETSYLQEDIVPIPRTVVTRYVHSTAYCPHCERQVIHPLDGELPFAPIGPNAKAVALYMRHGLKLPYRKINESMKTLFGLDFVAASTLGFEKRARSNAEPLHQDLIAKMRASAVVHADETHWREDGENHYVWYAGNESVAVFRIDPHRTSEAANALLGETLEGFLVTDAYAAYNALEARGGRQSCLVHILRKSREIRDLLDGCEEGDPASRRFCDKVGKLMQDACALVVPAAKKARQALVAKFQARLAAICGKKPLCFAKAETLRQRMLPESREHPQLFAFILCGGPPSNNHAERAVRPLVIFRKICMGTRSKTGSENISIFTSLAQTASLQGASLIDMFRALFRSSPKPAHDAIFGPPP